MPVILHTQEAGSMSAQTKNINTKKGYQSGSSGKAPALQVWGLEFKPEYQKKV
jgi:hypothetical protein